VRLWLVGGVLALAIARPATAADDAPLAKRTPLAPVVAVIPGAAIHGLGHFVAHEPAIGTRLLIAEGVAIGGIATSLSILALTGASRRIVAPVATLAVTSVGLLFISALADLYGVVAPRNGFGTPLRALPFVETSAGVRAIYDPQFSHRWFAMQSIGVRAGAFHFGGEAWQAPGGPTSQLMATTALRLSGPTTRPQATRDGTYVDLVAALTHRAFRGDGFSTLTAEMRFAGRLDLHRFARTMRGSFAELQIGGALASHHYAHGGSEGDGVLIVRVAYGLYLGRSSELSLFYDHRRDTLAGGMLLPGIGAGYVGVFGVQGRHFFDRAWGLSADAQVGSAYMAALSLVFRQGAVAW
jgi:hypothetical protein